MPRSIAGPGMCHDASTVNSVPNKRAMTNSSFVTGDTPSGAFSIGGGYWRHTADKNWLGADLPQAKDIV